MAEPHPWTPTARFELTAVEFDVIWEHLGLGAHPAVLRLPSPGRTRAERVRVVAAGLDGLRARGLAGPSGTEPGLVRLLRLLARPQRQLEIRGWFGQPLRAVAAEREGDGALAVHSGGTVTVSATGSPAHAAVTVLPVRASGPGPSIRLPSAALAAILGDRTAPDPLGGHEPGDTAEDVRNTLLRGPAHRAQICAVRLDRWGSPRRVPGHVAVVDTRRGRYRLSRETGPHGGPEWATLAPAENRDLRSELDALFSPGRSAASVDAPPR